MTAKIPPVKYTRDFYPEDMVLRDAIESAWARASQQAGFQPWDSPIFESLELYKRKSGDEIVNQLYNLTDQGGRELAIRPEMTPSLARMVAQRQQSLARPLKWYCIARMCRTERKQRGRLREFWQWNIDMLAESSPLADAEVISVGIDALVFLGLTSEHVEVRLNSRTLMESLLVELGLDEAQCQQVYAVTDKRDKVEPDKLEEMYQAIGMSSDTLAKLQSLLACNSLDDVNTWAKGENLSTYQPAWQQLADVLSALDSLGKKDWRKSSI